MTHRGRVLIRRESSRDIESIRTVTAAAFADPEHPDRVPVEAGLIDELRGRDAWLPALSLVAVDATDDVIGQVVCSRGRVEAAPVLGLGPIAVRPDEQRRGVGSALMHTVLGAADALDEPMVALLGDPGYYHRFGFRIAEEYGITPPVTAWGPYFQVRTLAAYDPSLRGTFTYPEPFDHV